MQVTRLQTFAAVTRSPELIARNQQISKAARLQRVQHFKNTLMMIAFFGAVIASGFCN